MTNTILNKLKQKGLKITPQRIAVYEAVIKMKNHPTAENVTEYIRKNNPNVSVGTVYKVLDTFVQKDLLQKIKSEKDIIRYDAVLSNHHHLYCSDTDRIEDYEDEQLDEIIKKYFKSKKIKNFQIEDIKLEITGKFTKRKGAKL